MTIEQQINPAESTEQTANTNTGGPKKKPKKTKKRRGNRTSSASTPENELAIESRTPTPSVERGASPQANERQSLQETQDGLEGKEQSATFNETAETGLDFKPNELANNTVLDQAKVEPDSETPKKTEPAANEKNAASDMEHASPSADKVVCAAPASGKQVAEAVKAEEHSSVEASPLAQGLETDSADQTVKICEAETKAESEKFETPANSPGSPNRSGGAATNLETVDDAVEAMEAKQEEESPASGRPSGSASELEKSFHTAVSQIDEDDQTSTAGGEAALHTTGIGVNKSEASGSAAAPGEHEAKTEQVAPGEPDSTETTEDSKALKLKGAKITESLSPFGLAKTKKEQERRSAKAQRKKDRKALGKQKDQLKHQEAPVESNGEVITATDLPRRQSDVNFDEKFAEEELSVTASVITFAYHSDAGDEVGVVPASLTEEVLLSLTANDASMKQYQMSELEDALLETSSASTIYTPQTTPSATNREFGSDTHKVHAAPTDNQGPNGSVNAASEAKEADIAPAETTSAKGPAKSKSKSKKKKKKAGKGPGAANGTPSVTNDNSCTTVPATSSNMPDAASATAEGPPSK